jgi:hypothetical protein
MKIRIYSKKGLVASGTFLAVRDIGEWVGLVLSDPDGLEVKFAEDEIECVVVDHKSTFVSTQGDHSAVAEEIGE